MKTKLRLGIIGAGSVVREIYQHLYFRSEYSSLLEICAVANPGEQYRNWFGDLAKLPAHCRFADWTWFCRSQPPRPSGTYTP